MITVSGSSNRRPIGAWVYYFAAASSILLGVAGLWSQIDFSLGSVAASGKIISLHPQQVHSSSVTAEVDVSGLGPKPIRTQVNVGVGSQSGDTVDLVCVKDRCQIDSWFDRWLFPLIALAIGVTIIVWRVRKREAPRHFGYR